MSWVWVLGPVSKVLDFRSWALRLELESQVPGLESWIFDSRSRVVLGPSPFSAYYKVRQKIITKCGRYYKV